jgi:hypothetical protein
VDPADELVDQLTPSELDWRRLVGRYPLASLLVAGVGGYVLGRSRGLDVVEQLAGFAADRVVHHINEELGEEVL